MMSASTMAQERNEIDSYMFVNGACPLEAVRREGGRVAAEADDGQDEPGAAPAVPAGEERGEIDEERQDIEDEGDREERRFCHSGLLMDSKMPSNSAWNASRLFAACPPAARSTFPWEPSRTTRISRGGQ